MSHGVRAFTLCLQGGSCGYEGAVNSAFNPDGSLRETYLKRVRRVIEACDRNGAVVILGCYYQRQDQVLKDEAAVRAGVVNVANWVREHGFTNVVLEIANEFSHAGFDHKLLKSAGAEAELIALAKKTAPGLLVATSGLGDGELPDEAARAGDFLLIHFNNTPLDKIPGRIAALKKHGKPIVCNEDDKLGADGANAAGLCVASGASWGLMLVDRNQHFPFTFEGAADDAVVYAAFRKLAAQTRGRAAIASHRRNRCGRRPRRRAVAGAIPVVCQRMGRGGNHLQPPHRPRWRKPQSGADGIGHRAATGECLWTVLSEPGAA